MLFSPFLSILAGFLWCASALLRPWEITRLSVSGLPYRGEAGLHEPLNTLAVEVRDPNEYAEPDPLVQCITKFPYASPPYRHFINCSEVPYGQWDFSFMPSQPPKDSTETQYWNPGQDFTLVLRLLRPAPGSWSSGNANFSVSPGRNMRGLCSAGGICSFTLKEDMVPVHVQQIEQ